MVRISKLSDYAIVLLTQFAADPAHPVKNARDLAEQAHMPVPTVSKILKALARGELLVSRRGVKGGYSLARAADAISIAEVILAIDGPITLTECTSDTDGLCALERRCPLRSNWLRINQVVRGALEQLKLSEMAAPLPLTRLTAVGPQQSIARSAASPPHPHPNSQPQGGAATAFAVEEIKAP